MSARSAGCVWILSCIVMQVIAAGSGGDDDYNYDGTEAALDKQFYHLYKSGAPEPDKLSALQLPKAVTKRLDKYGAKFSYLSPWLQRALLWDSGLVLERDSKSNLIQVYTQCQSSMSGIALSTPNYKALNCTFNPNCSDYAPRNGACSGDTISQSVLCATDSVSTAYDSAMWATGGSPDMIPEPNLVRHQWTENNRPQLIFAVHTLGSDEVHYADCPKKGKAGMIIPCVDKASSKKKWCVPTNGELVSSWLAEETGNPGNKSTGFNLLWLVLIIGGVVFVVIIAVIIFLLCRKKRSARDDHDRVEAPRSPGDSNAPYHAAGMMNAGVPSENGSYRPPPVAQQAQKPDLYAQYVPPPTYDESLSRGSRDSSNRHRPEDGRSGSSFGHTSHNPTATQSSTGSYRSHQHHQQQLDVTVMERKLLEDAEVARSRIPFENIEFMSLLARGGYGEVWVCQYLGKTRAIKRLLAHKTDAQKDVDDFISEIKLTASLDHSNIVRYIGVTWRSVDTLGMLLEYLPKGELLAYLQLHGDTLTWPRDKLLMAVGIARAVEYLHGQRTPIIHRDLKAKNVLLTEQLDAKLIDFGVSRDRIQETMTAAVGTPYWSAPELLEGRRYNEKSDVFSFGVLLSEMDNGHIPYQNLKSKRTGEAMRPLEILNLIVSGELRPTFTPDCPELIVRVANLCLQGDPDQRPGAGEVVRMLISTTASSMVGSRPIYDGLD